MKLIIGIGNPGGEYVNTPHNAGFFVIENLHITKPGVVAKKSTVFMNESGNFIKDLVEKYNVDLENLYIVHDDLDIKLGEYKIQFGRGPKDHNGINSIDRELGTDQYWHVRVGVDNRPDDNRVAGVEYVLQQFSDKEKEILGSTVKNICKKLETIFNNPMTQ